MSDMLLSSILQSHKYKPLSSTNPTVFDFKNMEPTSEAEKLITEQFWSAVFCDLEDPALIMPKLDSDILFPYKEDIEKAVSIQSSLSARGEDSHLQDVEVSGGFTPKLSEIIKRISISDVIEKIKEVYRACTCKICKCLAVGYPTDWSSGQQPRGDCGCTPCSCDDCTHNSTKEPQLGRFLSPEIATALGIYSNRSDCTCAKCECALCRKASVKKLCRCAPCQCVECKSFVGSRRQPDVIVAAAVEPAHEGGCSCSPCECLRCRTRDARTAASTSTYEISTGLSRHPNCHCEMCDNDDCAPNDTDTCRCVNKKKITSKPTSRDVKDYDVHRTTVPKNLIKFDMSNKSVFNTLALSVQMDSYQSLDKNSKEHFNVGSKLYRKRNCTSQLDPKNQKSIERVYKPFYYEMYPCSTSNFFNNHDTQGKIEKRRQNKVEKYFPSPPSIRDPNIWGTSPYADNPIDVSNDHAMPQKLSTYFSFYKEITDNEASNCKLKKPKCEQTKIEVTNDSNKPDENKVDIITDEDINDEHVIHKYSAEFFDESCINKPINESLYCDLLDKSSNVFSCPSQSENLHHSDDKASIDIQLCQCKMYPIYGVRSAEICTCENCECESHKPIFMSVPYIPEMIDVDRKSTETIVFSLKASGDLDLKEANTNKQNDETSVSPLHKSYEKINHIENMLQEVREIHRKLKKQTKH